MFTLNGITAHSVSAHYLMTERRAGAFSKRARAFRTRFLRNIAL
jgi:hypothetical protein